jgi:hypothetical protein
VIRFNWKRQSDGTPVAKISVQHVVSRNKAASLFIAYTRPREESDLRNYSKAHIEHCIRSQLRDNPDRADFWGDEYDEKYGSDLSVDRVLEWAQRQVARL